ncbi:hypothetical protein [Mesobacillus zeae]|uniref:hypothetical protein n=1 Tax=Mesobacillus zeae TaxID=1917180 RepID=UPI003009AAD8
MKIDFVKFENNLQKYRVTKAKKLSDAGVAKVIEYVLNQVDTKQVDFNSFAFHEGERAFFDFYTLPHHDDEVTEGELLKYIDHPWEIYATVTSIMGVLHKNKKKVFENNEDDFI